MDKHFQALDHQDWKTITVSKGNKKNTPSRPMLSESQQRENKILEKADNDELTHKKVSNDIRKQIQLRRCELKWTQKELAQKVNLQVSLINDIESGKAVYNPQHINKLKRVLKL